VNRQTHQQDPKQPQAQLHGTPDPQDPRPDAPGHNHDGDDPDAPLRDPGQKPRRQDPDPGNPQVDEPDGDRQR
jgi:hypothetical protein